MEPVKVLIMGAAGRDFHNFNLRYRDNEMYRVVAFTATQIPDIDGRMYPPELAGSLYPDGIAIKDEADLEQIISDEAVDLVVFSYSDVTHEYVMHKASLVVAAGADFAVLGAEPTMVKATVPVVSICAIRTGCGKSQTTRRVARILQGKGKKVVAIRHPMPYGDLVKQKVQRFATLEDLDLHDCTIEEREEYEPSSRPRPRPTWSSGTAATTTCPSTSRTWKSWSPTPTGWGTSSPTSPASRTCSAPTWW